MTKDTNEKDNALTPIRFEEPEPPLYPKKQSTFTELSPVGGTEQAAEQAAEQGAVPMSAVGEVISTHVDGAYLGLNGKDVLSVDLVGDLPVGTKLYAVEPNVQAELDSLRSEVERQRACADTYWMALQEVRQIATTSGDIHKIVRRITTSGVSSPDAEAKKNAKFYMVPPDAQAIITGLKQACDRTKSRLSAEIEKHLILCDKAMRLEREAHELRIKVAELEAKELSSYLMANESKVPFTKTPEPVGEVERYTPEGVICAPFDRVKLHKPLPPGTKLYAEPVVPCAPEVTITATGAPVTDMFDKVDTVIGYSGDVGRDVVVSLHKPLYVITSDAKEVIDRLVREKDWWQSIAQSYARAY